MFISADQLVAHAIGDYVLQSDWMASEKTQRSLAALAHVVTYSLSFLLLTRSPLALVVIAGTHFVIDRWRLARFVCWAKNWISPFGYVPWKFAKGTGYYDKTPDWLAVWLLIIADNLMHIVINAAALRWLG